MNQKPEKTSAEKANGFKRLFQSKSLRPILISAIIVLACALVYLVLSLTVLKEPAQEETPTIGNHGEQMASGRPFVIDPFSFDALQGIRVENDFGGFYFYRGEDDEFYFENAEAVLYDSTTAWHQEQNYASAGDVLQNVSIVDSLMNFCRYLLSTEEVVGYDAEHMDSYGLAGRGRAAMTLEYTDSTGKEVKNTVFFGDKTVDGTGYYVAVEGRDAVYILLDTYITRCIFTDVRAYFLPQVAPLVSSASYMETATMSVVKHGEEFLSLRHVTDEEYKMNGELFTHIFTNPAGYYPSPENIEKVFSTFVDFKGNQVVEYDIASRLENPDLFEETHALFRSYALMGPDGKWNYELTYSYKDMFESTLYISERMQVEGSEGDYIYYVYSPAFDVIVEFSATKLPWVEWDLLKFMDNHSFSATIDSVSSIQLIYGDTNVKFSLQGELNDLTVTSSTGVKVDTDNFRQLYKAILFTTMDGYADQSADASKILTIFIKLRNGNEYHYDFYGMTARKAYYTLNDSGQFYINRDYVKQIAAATNALLNGETVTVERKK